MFRQSIITLDSEFDLWRLIFKRMIASPSLVIRFIPPTTVTIIRLIMPLPLQLHLLFLAAQVQYRVLLFIPSILLPTKMAVFILPASAIWKVIPM